MELHWPQSLASGHSPLPCGNAHKTQVSAACFLEGFGPPPSGRFVRPRFHARATDATVTNPSHARIRSQARLDHSRANQRSRLWRIATRTTRNIARYRSPPRNRYRAGLAIGSMGSICRRSRFDAPRTSAPRSRFRIADGSTRSDNASRARDGWTTRGVCRVRKGDHA